MSDLATRRLTMTPEKAKALREPFPADMIGKLPKPTKADNPKGKCPECGGWHGLPAVHLDYVGHAATTDRLLQVDPEWTWEPLTTDENGCPIIANGGLWIKLTICGVTRPGWGDGKNIKEMIGDAIRNAAMRFGVALDLWAKEDLHASGDDTPLGRAPAKAPPVPPPARQASTPTDAQVVTAAQVTRLWAIVRAHQVTDDAFRQIVTDIAGVDSTKLIPAARYDAVISAVEANGVAA